MKRNLSSILPQQTTTGRVPPPEGENKPGDRRPIGRNLVLIAFSIYFLLPLWWLLVASTKTMRGLFTGANGALWFDSEFDLLGNLNQMSQHGDGIYWRWLGNSFLYASVAGVASTVLAVLAGYGFAKYAFRGRPLAFSVLLGAVMVPTTALVLPIFVLFSAVGLTNTIWAVILPSSMTPFGVYLMRIYAQDAIPDEMMDAARIDGASEWRIFISIAFPLLKPAVTTVLLLGMVGTWNNYFLPLALLSDPKLFPITVGLSQWLTQSALAGGGQQLWNLVVVGSLVSILPLIALFLFMQRYWQAGLSLGSVKA